MELKHLAPYLPYNLKAYQVFDKELLERDVTVHNVMSFVQGDTNAKIALRPLSDLTKEIDVNGERFIPALELARLKTEIGMHQDNAPSVEFSYKIINKPFGKMLKVSKLDEWVVMLSFSDPSRIPHFLFEKLIEWHMDVHDFIGKGEAIDINTL